jgi:RNA polymerase sigma-70 factor (ECF subfamily)
MLEDKLLIWKFNQGDTNALCRIYQKYRSCLLRVAMVLLNDRGGAEDVLHDVFVDFAETAGGFRLRGSLKGYLSICVANLARDKNREARRHEVAQPEIGEGAGLSGTEPDSSVESGPYRCAVGRELMEKVNYALSQVPFEQRETIVLHLQGEMRFREIAAAKGISVNTVLSRYRYGMEKLHSNLDGELAQ